MTDLFPYSRDDIGPIRRWKLYREPGSRNFLCIIAARSPDEALACGRRNTTVGKKAFVIPETRAELEAFCRSENARNSIQPTSK